MFGHRVESSDWVAFVVTCCLFLQNCHGLLRSHDLSGLAKANRISSCYVGWFDVALRTHGMQIDRLRRKTICMAEVDDHRTSPKDECLVKGTTLVPDNLTVPSAKQPMLHQAIVIEPFHDDEIATGMKTASLDSTGHFFSKAWRRVRSISKIDRKAAAKLGVAFGITYNIVSNINGSISLSIAWFLASKKVRRRTISTRILLCDQWLLY